MRRINEPQEFLIKNLEAIDLMAETAEEIYHSYKEYLSNETEMTPRMKQNMIDGLAMKIQVFGEQSTNVSDEFQHKHDVIRWGDFRKFRNIISHDYGLVDSDIIFAVSAEMLRIRDNLDEVLYQYE